jgi:hypothetical protein
MKNTVIGYMYRDASNYKAYNEVVVRGKLTLEQLKDTLEEECFIPAQVGLPELQSRLSSFPSSDDHVWHTIERVEPTDEEATVKIAGSTLRGRFLYAKKRGWDIVRAMERLGL